MRRQAAGRRVHAALPVQPHLLLAILARLPLYFAWIALISGCSICIRRCDTIWRPEERDQQDADDERQQDDRDADVAGQAVEDRQAQEDRLEDRREGPGEEPDRVRARGTRRTEVLGQGLGFGGGTGVGIAARVGLASWPLASALRRASG